MSTFVLDPTGRFESVRAALSETRLVIATKRLLDVLGLLRLCRPAGVLACERSPDAPQLAEALGSDFLTLEQTERRRGSDADHEALWALHGSHLLEWVSRHRNTTFMPYSSGPAWEPLRRSCADAMLYAAPDANVTSLLDDKVSTRASFRELGLPSIPFMVVSRTAAQFDLLARTLGLPYVVQDPHGSIGRETFLVEEPQQLDAALASMPEATERVIASAYVDGPVVNFHGLVGSDSVAITAPSVVLCGLAGVTNTRFGYCGNDFGAVSSLEPALMSSATEHARAVGAWLRSLGYRGVFGIDLVLHGGTAWPLEINPRLQGSTWVLGEAELRNGQCPTVARHLLSWLAPRTEVGGDGDATRLTGAFLEFRWQRQNALVRHGMDAGIHKISPNGLDYVRPSPGLLECALDEAFVTGLPPTPTCSIEHDAVIARVATWQTIAAPTGTVNENGARLATTTLRTIDEWEILPEPASVR